MCILNRTDSQTGRCLEAQKHTLSLVSAVSSWLGWRLDGSPVQCFEFQRKELGHYSVSNGKSAKFKQKCVILFPEQFIRNNFMKHRMYKKQLLTTSY